MTDALLGYLFIVTVGGLVLTMCIGAIIERRRNYDETDAE